MPESESFDAFYARTVWNVTSQMHALAGEDSAADHAIREAYAKAYQQWYEVSGYPDTEGWVLAVAKDAYERRRPEAGDRIATPVATGHDPLSWPGMFRPRPATAEADPAATIGRPSPGSVGGLTAGPAGGPRLDVASEPAVSTAGLLPGRPGGALATTRVAADPQDLPGPPRDPLRPGRSPLPGFRSRRPLIALVAVVAVVVAGAAVYLTASGRPAGQSAHRGTAGGTGRPAVRMLAAGRTGNRASIPWSIVGTGWTLAEVSGAPAGTAAGNGTFTTYLVDPQGGRYQIQTSSGPTPRLLAWSGDAQNALYAVPAGDSGAGVTYDLLALKTGNVTELPLPASVTAVGFSRPDGLAILAVRQTSDAFRLQRFTLAGALQATIGTLPRKQHTPDWLPGCSTGCGALSSPDGTRDVWGVAGDQMQLVGNAGGLIKRLDVPGSGSPPSCVPLTWWNAATVLAYCAVSGQQYPVGRLWLVPTDGSAPSALTGVSGSAAGSGVVTGAWPGPGSVYVTATDGQQCGGASGPGGLALLKLAGGSLQSVTVQGTTGNHTSVVSVSDGRLLVLAQTSCPGTSSLLWLNPSTGATTTVLAAPNTRAGVLFAVPYGPFGQTATSAG